MPAPTPDPRVGRVATSDRPIPLLRLRRWLEYRRSGNTISGGAAAALTQSQMIAAVAHRADLSKAEAKRALEPPR